MVAPGGAFGPVAEWGEVTSTREAIVLFLVQEASRMWLRYARMVAMHSHRYRTERRLSILHCNKQWI